MPLVSGPRQPAPDLVGEALAELQAPLPYRLVADRDAAGCEDLVHMAQAQGRAEVEPDGIADDLSWEPMASIAGRGGRRHPARLPAPIGWRKPTSRQVDGAALRPQHPYSLDSTYPHHHLTHRYGKGIWGALFD